MDNQPIIDLATHRPLKTIAFHVPEFGQTHELVMDGQSTIAELQAKAADIMQKCHGRAVRTKLLGLPVAPSDLALSELKLKAPHAIVLLPSPAHIEDGRITSRLPAEHHYIFRNVDEEAISTSDADGIRRKIALRVSKYVGYMQLEELDPHKKNLVLDIDYTMLDTDVFNNTSLTPSHWRRPNLHEFLETVYPYYNIIVWSATGNAHVQHKLQECGLLSSTRFRIALLIDYGAMVRVRVDRGGVAREFNTKPLQVLWGIWPTMTKDNTLIVDDHRRSFVMNSDNGIHVSSYRSKAGKQDQEFKILATYLLDIRHVRSVRSIHHDYWREVAQDQVPLSAVEKRDMFATERRHISRGSSCEETELELDIASTPEEAGTTVRVCRRTRSVPRHAGTVITEAQTAIRIPSQSASPTLTSAKAPFTPFT